MRPLDRLAERHGIVLDDDGFDGSRPIPDSTLVRALSAFGVDASTPKAIARALKQGTDGERAQLRAPPGRTAFLPDWLREGRAWGVAVQLYELRSQRNCGIGDFADLAAAAGVFAAAGADFVAVSPLHALFPAAPSRCSPYSPSNRRFLNVLHIAPDAVPGFEPDMIEQREAAALRAAELVDYPRVADLKLGALRRVFAAWRRGVPGPAAYSRDAFAAFRAAGGEALRRHAVFEALSQSLLAQSPGGGWRSWPPAYRDPESAAVAQFARENGDAVEFHAWLQFVADAQLAAAAAAAREAGMRIGLYLDLAVGEVPDGSATWSDPALSARGMSIGAPPDMFTAAGQEWGLAPPAPEAFAREGHAAFRAVIRASLRHAGALRIDHVMALWQLFFVPEGGHPADGVYVRFPLERLLEILAELSHQHRAVLIGEDLGHVPPGFRDAMAAAVVLSYRILYFEKYADHFLGVVDYPRLALACLSTHDLPTLCGWWAGDDIALRLEHGLIDAAAAERQWQERAHERHTLIDLLRWAHAADAAAEAAVGEALAAPERDLPQALVVAAHRAIARTPCLLVSARLADLVGERRPTNLPGTVDSHPNWRRKCAVPLETLAAHPRYRAVTAALAAERPR